MARESTELFSTAVNAHPFYWRRVEEAALRLCYELITSTVPGHQFFRLGSRHLCVREKGRQYESPRATGSKNAVKDHTPSLS